MFKCFVFMIAYCWASLSFAGDELHETCVPLIWDPTFAEVSVIWTDDHPVGYYILVKSANEAEPIRYKAQLSNDGFGFESTDSKIDLNIRFALHDVGAEFTGVIVRDGNFKESAFFKCHD